MSSTSLPDHDSLKPLQDILQLMAAHFSLVELQTLCFDLHVNYDELPYPGLTPKIRDLLQVMVQNGRLLDLHTAVSQVLPSVNWPSVDNLLADTLAFPPLAPQATVSAQGEGATAIAPRGVNIQNSTIYGNVITGDTYNYYFEGTGFYLPEFTTAVKNFLYNYLGDEKNPVPFGGRDDALAQLEQWRIQTDAPPRLLLTAPAGRGKSALLVRWSAALQAQPDVAVVFMPISIRFSTNQESDTFSLLATRLAHLYGKQIPERWGNFPASAWRRLVAEYLQEPLPDGRSLLLIIDGLDEAAWEPGADLFPLQLPERVRLVVSARYRGGEETGPAPWLRRLGWDRFPQLVVTMELQALTQAGVKDVLERMGCPLDELGRNVDLVTELYRLSEGDPLLVELYVKELWQRGEMTARLQPEDLQRIQPGYKGYFARWWAEQEKLWGNDDPLSKTLASTLLDVLAMALGPLLLIDVRQLLPTPFSSRELRRAIRSLNRFVVGDGGEQGIAFAHPKLGEYFRDELDVDEQATWRARFLVWGERTMVELQSRQLRPCDVSRYLMLYYCIHLVEAKADIEKMLPLASWEWMQISYESTGTYAGFLQDVDRIWKQLQEINEVATKHEQQAPYIGYEVLCALCHASVNTVADNTLDELLVLLLQFHVWDAEQVVAYIRQRNDVHKRAKGLASILGYLSKVKRENVLEEIKIATQVIGNEKDQADVLKVVAPYLPEETLALAQKMTDEGSQATVLQALAAYLPEETLALAQKMSNEWSQATVLQALAAYLPEETLALAQKMSNEWSQATVLQALAAYLPEETLVVASNMVREDYRADALVALIPYLSAEVQAAVLNSVLTDAQCLHPDFRAYTLVEIAQYLPKEMRDAILKEAYLDAEGIRYDDDRASAMVVVALSLTEEMRKTVLVEALEARDRCPEDERAATLVIVAPHLPEAVLVAAQEISDESSRTEILIRVAPYLPEAVLKVLHGIRNGQKQASILVAVAPHLPEEIRPVVIDSALTMSQGIYDEESRAGVLVEIAAYLPREILACVYGIYDEKNRAEVLIALTPYLPNDVFEFTQKMGDERNQAKVLPALASYLPEKVLLCLRGMRSTECKAEVLAAIAPFMPYEVMETVRERTLDFWVRVSVLQAVAPYLSADMLTQLREEDHAWGYVMMPTGEHLVEKSFTAIENQEDEESPTEVMADMVPQFPFYALCRRALITNSQSTRPILFSTIKNLLPQIQWLGGEKGVRDTLDAIQKVTTWWP